MACRAGPTTGVCRDFSWTRGARLSDNTVNEALGYLMRKLISKNTQEAAVKTTPSRITTHAPATSCPSLDFTGTGEEGSPPRAPPQLRQRRLSRVTFSIEATRPANLIVVDQCGAVTLDLGGELAIKFLCAHSNRRYIVTSHQFEKLPARESQNGRSLRLGQPVEA